MSTNLNPKARRVSATVALASTFGALNACSGDSKDATPTTDATTTTASAAAATAEFTGLGDDATITTSEYVGAVAGTEIYAAFAISRATDGGESRGGTAYFCDGTSVANWFRQVPSADGLAFESKSGATFTATVGADGSITADVPLGDKTYTVTAQEVAADGDAGLYLADHAIDVDLATDERGGWIVLADGTQRGAIRGGTTILPGVNIEEGTSNVVVAGREILLRAITHIIGLDKKD